jgi:hypothetical protein
MFDLLPKKHWIRVCIIIAFVVVFTLIVTGMCWHPHGVSLCGSEVQIRASILKMSPLGTPIEKVKTSILTRMHPNTFYYFEHAGIAQLPGVLREGKVIQGQWPLGGEHHGKEVWCQIGQSGLFEDASAAWVFDDKDRLADVFVYKVASLP